MNCVPWLIYDGLEDHLPFGLRDPIRNYHYFDHEQSVASSSAMLTRPHHSSERRAGAHGQEHQKKADHLIASLPSLQPHMCDPEEMYEKVCAICLDPLVVQSSVKSNITKINKKTITMTACHHHMHRQCLVTWLSKDVALSCPVCRVQVKPDRSMTKANDSHVQSKNSSVVVSDIPKHQVQKRQQQISHRRRHEQQHQVQDGQQQNLSRVSSRDETAQTGRRRGLHGLRGRWQMSNMEGGRRHLLRTKNLNP